MRKILPIVAILVSLLFVGLLPVVKAPNNQTWDVIYNVDGAYPDASDPVWTRVASGTPVRSIVWHNQILHVELDSLDVESYYQFIPDDETTEFFVMEGRVNFLWNASGGNSWFRFQCEQYDPGLIFAMEILPYVPSPIIRMHSPGSNTDYYLSNFTDENHTYRIVVYHDDGGTRIDGYMDESYVGTEFYASEAYIDWVLWRMTGESTYALVTEVDYVAYRYLDLEQKLEDELAERDARIDELEKELERLRKRLGSSLPETYVNQTNLPVVPQTSRGTLEYDTLFVDPYLVTVYDLLTFKSGSDLDFYLIYPTSSDEVTVISDEIYIAETSSFNRLWINDTVGASELLNVTAVTYFNLEYGYNITVQVSGASAEVRADRKSTVRLIDAFEWGESTQTGIFGTTNKIENDLGFEDMSNVLIRWAFPTEDSENRVVHIDMQSVTVYDEDNNLELDRGRHYSLDESSVIMELRWLNTSDSRTFKIEFTRESFVESEEYFTVYDNNIGFSDTYGDAPYTTNIHFTASGRAFFEGKIIVKFQLTGQYAGEHLDTRSLRIKRSDTSLAQDFTYDSISNELRITDQTVSAGESITYTLYFDWYDEKSAVYELILGDPLILYSLLLLAGFAGLFIFLDAKSEEKRRKYAGLIIIGVDVIILIIILVVSYT